MQLRFSQSLYHREAVLRSAEAYAEHFRAQLTEEGGDLVVNLEGEDFPDEVLDSFANHVLFETVRLRQRAAEIR